MSFQRSNTREATRSITSAAHTRLARARRYLAAARVLLDVEEPCPNAAASRAYYAAYHACWHAMNAAGIPTPEVRSGVYYFLHEPLPRDAHEAGVLDGQAREALDWLAHLRVVADYLVEELTVEMVRDAVETSAHFIRSLLGEEPAW